jgi:hypothetical protein
VSVLLASFCLPEIFGGEEQFRQAGQAAWFLGRGRILDLARAAMRVRVARS